MKTTHFLLTVGLLLALSACGGGGGGGNNEGNNNNNNNTVTPNTDWDALVWDQDNWQ